MTGALVKNDPSPFAAMLEAARPRLAMLIPTTVGQDRVLAVIQNIVARDEKIRECTPSSVVRAVVQSAELGLDPSPKLGQVWFIPRSAKVRGTDRWEKICEMQIGYKGALKKAYECERILSVDAVPVHEADRFEIHRGTHPDILHEYKLGERGPILGCYFAARLTPHEGNVWRVDHMNLADLLAIRDRSDGWRAFKAGRIKSTPWDTDQEEMMRKVMLVRGLKTCPISDAFRAALEADADDFRSARRASTEPTTTGSTRDADLKAKLGVTPAAVEVPDAEYEDVDPENDGR